MSPSMNPDLTILIPLPDLLVPLSPSHSSLYLSGIFRCRLHPLRPLRYLYSASTTTTTYFSTFTTSSYLSTTSLSSTIIVASFP